MPNPALSNHPVPLGHPSNGGELGTFPSRNSYPLRRMGLLTFIPSRNKVPLCGGVPQSGGVVYQELRVTSTPTAVIAKERETLKTLAYACGNPVQYVCGHSPAVLFNLLDRHAPLAMTKGTKCPSTHRSCHSRAWGPRKYECICGVVKAGIGSIKFVLRIASK